jgi:SAM-dependent methyltransferase
MARSASGLTVWPKLVESIDVDLRGEDELTGEDWLYARKATFAQLRKFEAIPQELIDLVEQFDEHVVVKPFLYTGSKEDIPHFGIEVIKSKPDLQKLTESMAAFHRAHNANRRRWTASETLSFILRVPLRALKSAERKRKAAPVRRLNLVPRSPIARTAMYLLEACERDDCSPGACLNGLLRELLNVATVKRSMMYHDQDQKFVSFAAYIIAQLPSIGTRKLARIMNVDPSTLSRWRRSPEFKMKVEKIAKHLASIKTNQRPDQDQLLRLLPQMARIELPAQLAGSIPSSVRAVPAFFDETEMPTPGWWEALWPDPAGVLLAVGIGQGMDVIDLCSGDGWFTLQIAKIAKSVEAIDIDPALLEITRHRLTEAGLHNCEYIAGDAYDVARLSPRRADFVFMANTLYGVPDGPRLAAAVRKSLKPTGRFAVINWHPRPREDTVILGKPRGPRTELRMSPEQTIAAVEASGLKLERILEVPPYHYAAIFRNPA